MFTGIVEALGKIVALERRDTDARMRIAPNVSGFSNFKIGDSIAVSGVCLTVAQCSGDAFIADISAETLSRTTLGERKVGDAVNLETALLPTTRLGGHLVSGHVDGVGVVHRREPDGGSLRLRIGAPAILAKYIAVKGSICIDGVSLTVNAVDGAVFDVNVIPHTAAHTTLGEFDEHRRVNIEVDVLARYLERLLLGADAQVRPAITRDFLARHGFLK